MAMRVKIEDIRCVETDLDGMRELYLRQHGWTSHCDFPDSRWRWVKTFKRGGQVTAQLRDAVDLQVRTGEDHPIVGGRKGSIDPGFVVPNTDGGTA